MALAGKPTKTTEMVDLTYWVDWEMAASETNGVGNSIGLPPLVTSRIFFERPFSLVNQ